VESKEAKRRSRIKASRLKAFFISDALGEKFILSEMKWS
jgi:hypothetical protein